LDVPEEVQNFYAVPGNMPTNKSNLDDGVHDLLARYGHLAPPRSVPEKVSRAVAKTRVSVS